MEPLISAALDAAYSVFTALSTLLEPIVGALAAAVAIVLVTLALRLLLIPVGVSQVRADIHRRRLAPKLAALRKRYAKSPERLAKATQDLYRDEKVSPFAGILPALAQAPVLALVYGVFIHPQINGHPNRLLGNELGGVSLGESFFGALGPGDLAGLGVYAVLIAVLVGVGLLTRRQTLRLAPEPPTGIAAALGWLSLLTAAFALFVPLAAALYLATSSAWGLVERSVVRRVLTGTPRADGRSVTPSG